MSDIINQFVLWKPIKVVSVMAYILLILLLPFNSFWSVIILFAVICFWSRIPCLISIFTKDLDVIDFFIVMLGIHIGGLFGAVFGASVMLFSRLFGPREWFLYTLKDSASLFICGLLTPLYYSIFGSALYTLYAFTITRWVIYLILTAIVEPEAMGLEIGLCTIGSLKSYLYNTFVMKIFEGPLNTVFEGGVHFSVGLFLFATGVIAFFFTLSKFAKWAEAKKIKAKVMPDNVETIKEPLFVKTV